MKLILPSLLIVVASSVSAAAPPSVAQAQAAPSQPAPSADREALARRFVSLTITAEKFMDTFRAMAASTSSCGCGDSEEQPTAAKLAEQQNDVDRFLKLVEPKVRARMPLLVEAYAKIYAREFTADELQQMVTFAQSPAGAHYLSRRLQVEADPTVTEQEQGFWEDLVPAMQQFEREKCLDHTAKRIAAGEKNAKCPLTGKPDTRAG
ncbi:MAG TPA: DUF2059 domain-containing protein [Sphingomicrobium sp.]